MNVLNIEPYSNTGLELAGRFKKNEEYIVFNSPSETNAFFQAPKDSVDVNMVINTLISKLPSVDYDERIIKIVDYIKNNYFDIGAQYPQNHTRRHADPASHQVCQKKRWTVN